MNQDPELPQWLRIENKLCIPSKSNKFLQKNINSLNHTISHFNQPKVIANSINSSWAELINVLVMVLIIVNIRNLLLLWLMGVVFLYQFIKLPNRQIIAFIKSLLKITAFSVTISLPSILIANSLLSALIWTAKIILIIGMVQIFRHRTTWTELLRGLRQLHISNTFVLTLDITIKYSHVLSSYLQQMLQAIQLRTCGNPPHVFLLASQLLGRMYLMSRSDALELYNAMILRGYSSKSISKEKMKFSWADCRLLSLDAILIFICCYLGGTF